jgi:UDP-galactose transporter B1
VTTTDAGSGMSKQDTPKQETPFSQTHFLGCVGGIYASFLLWGWLQERLTKIEYGENGERFTFITFLNLVQYSFACAVARFAIWTGLAKTSANASGWELHAPFMRTATTNTLGSLMGYASLNYISFPLHILAKSCKLVPVMVMGFLINGKRYSTVEVIAVICITAGLCVFAGSKPSSGKGGHDEAQNSELFGIFLVFCNLGLDGFTNAMQDRMNQSLRPTPHEFMYFLNFWSVLLLLPCTFFCLPPAAAQSWGLPVEGSGWEAIGFLQRQPEAMWDMLLFCAAGAVGQNFIFTSLERYGAFIGTQN